MIRTLKFLFAIGLFGLSLPAPLAAQGQDMSQVQELVRQIRRNMIETEREIDRAEAQSAAERAEASQKDIEKLIESMKSRGGQISQDIEEVIKKLPKSGGGGGGGGGQSNSGGGSSGNRSSRENEGSSGQRDRNERENQQSGGENSSGNQDQNRPQNQDRPSGQDDSGAQNRPDGRNQDGRLPEPPPPEFIVAPDDAQRWGFLPQELRQRLLDRNFREFTPEYQNELRAYFRRLSTPRR